MLEKLHLKITKANVCITPMYLGDMTKYEVGDSPDEHLHNAAICYAAAIKSRPKDSNLHVRLGLVLEEQYYLQEIYGLEKLVSI